MTSEAKNRDRRNTVLAAVIGTVLACYAGSAAAIEFEFDNGAKVNWNTTLSFGASWRAERPEPLAVHASGRFAHRPILRRPLTPGTAVGPEGRPGRQPRRAAIGNLNYAQGRPLLDAVQADQRRRDTSRAGSAASCASRPGTTRP